MSSPPTFFVAWSEAISGTLNVAIINPIKAKNIINISPTKFNLNAENIKYIGIPIAAPIVEYIKAFVGKNK